MAIKKTTLGDLLYQTMNNDHIDEINHKESAIMSDKTYYKITLTILHYIEVPRYLNDAMEPELRTIDLTDRANRVDLIKLIHAITKLGLKKSKDICDFYNGHTHDPLKKPNFDFSHDHKFINIAFVISDKYSVETLADITRFAIHENERNVLNNVSVSIYKPIELPMIG